ncbi:aldehyde dehydrogenase [Gordonia sp. OPL2]|uniref:aldehyde dehydrogenase family protein n=1 Tax=Gordonia sp. OPL2 TaxID=2486274 RepID=UPI0016562471|nr:aldehyde dehydrogenase family protein [Gordonia sp. OPL2]ROZ88014.1 aldehyde dehydrogenase family protein [Gordonia sp. OPL2]
MVVDTHARSLLPSDDDYGRNIIGGRWLFPAAPYEFEIRNPVDSTITTVVPLSSRIDVERAITAAGEALHGRWSDPATREHLLVALLSRLTDASVEFAHLMSTESGVSHRDALDIVEASLGLARRYLSENRVPERDAQGCVSGHILSWGAPFAEMLLGVFAALVRGESVVVKPSLRGPMSPIAVAYLAEQAGFPAGVVNVVQGTGVDVGAALISSNRLGQLSVHGNSDTLARSARAYPFTNVPLSTLRGGGNAAVVYPDASAEDIAHLALEVAAAVRVNSAGSLFGLHTVAVHSACTQAVRAALVDAVSNVGPAPLPAELQRRQAMSRVHRLSAAGGRVLCGGKVPDDVKHRMGWFVTPTVIDLGTTMQALPLMDAVGAPLGPVLTVIEWATFDDIDKLFAARRHQDGYGITWGDCGGRNIASFGAIARGQGPLGAARSGLVPPAWVGRRSSAGDRQ